MPRLTSEDCATAAAKQGGSCTAMPGMFPKTPRQGGKANAQAVSKDATAANQSSGSDDSDDGSDSDDPSPSAAGRESIDSADEVGDHENDGDEVGAAALHAGDEDAAGGDSQELSRARIAWGSFFREKKKDKWADKMPDLVKHSSVALDFLERMKHAKLDFLLKCVQKLHNNRKDFPISKLSKPKKVSQLRGFFVNATQIVGEQERPHDLGRVLPPRRHTL